MKLQRSIFACLTLLAGLATWGHPARSFATPLQVFILCGQSNMQGHAHVRTLEHIGMDPATVPLLDAIQAEDGTAKVHDQIWISYLSSGGVKQGKLTTGYGANDDKFGPELTFGIFAHQRVGEPILIIKTAWGGKSLHTDFRPPSAGPYRFNDAQLEQMRKQEKDLAEIKAAKQAATGHYYRLTVDRVRTVLSDLSKVCPNYDPNDGYELAGFVWFQGWNDMVDRGTYPQRDQPGGYDAYSDVLAHFIRDVRKDLNAPHLPFVIGALGAGGPVELYSPAQQRYRAIHQNFRQAMAAPASLPEFNGNVVAVMTEKYWDQELNALRAKESTVNQKVRKLQTEQSLTRDEVRATREELMAAALTPRQREILAKGISNAEFHYLGSGKIMAQIGRGFAEALATISPSP